MTVIDVACGLMGRYTVDGPEVFLSKRGVGRSYAGCWETPGGKREAGETLEQAMCREWREELGQDVLVVRYLWRQPVLLCDGVARGDVVQAHFLEVVGVSGAPVSTLGQEGRWFRPSELGVLPMPVAGDQCRHRIGGWLCGYLPPVWVPDTRWGLVPRARTATLRHVGGLADKESR